MGDKQNETPAVMSLIDLFTPEQVRKHIAGLRQCISQSKAKNENSCQLCGAEELFLESPPIYCSPCGACIKRDDIFYQIKETNKYFCIPCYTEARGVITVDGTAMPKKKMAKKTNEVKEWWVWCDKCKTWQHQICALFNHERNVEEAKYICPHCYIAEVEKGERNPLPQSAVLGAKDLPRTILSDHIEERLLKRLKEERQERARDQGKSYDEVPGAEPLVVRVVSSVDKKVQVKERFLEIFQGGNIPTNFPYKSKELIGIGTSCRFLFFDFFPYYLIVLLLFQRIEGVEVCIFAMYVQEFGSQCQEPNHRRVYLEYLDSVKYFRPEIKTVTGEALRTFVYHEILIGYLDYCKKRGFSSCYLWACPPLNGEDYILHCHPEIQKNPESNQLRNWYLCMLSKAERENIVVELTTLYHHFFASSGERKAKVSATRLPYFNGDYWPCAAEDVIYQLQQQDEKKPLEKAQTKRINRALEASGHSGNESKDSQLMRELGSKIFPTKEDFIMVHLQHACTHCSLLMVSGKRWVCNECQSFQLCDKCYKIELELNESNKHPCNQRIKHSFYPVVIFEVPEDTEDEDSIISIEIFDTRQEFLNLCKGKYQYDTLRRAKHSSMMVLYHLHNPTVPALVIKCNFCHHNIEDGQGWHCGVCPGYKVCNTCYHQKDGTVVHPHELTNHLSTENRNAQRRVARQKRVEQYRKMLDLLVHASQCRISSCPDPACGKLKDLFRHGRQCNIRAPGGCYFCGKMWELLLHASTCENSGCSIPHCRNLKELLKKRYEQQLIHGEQQQ